MSHISSDHRFTSWGTFQNGAATAVISNGVLACQSPDTSSSAYGRKRIFLKPGELVTVRFVARLISGGGDTAPGCNIEFPSEGDVVSGVKLDSTEWKEYAVSFAAPWTAGDGDYLQISLGSFTNRVGEAEFILPSIDISNAIYGAPRRIAQAYIKLDAGVASLHSLFANHGVRSVSYSAANKELTVTVDPVTEGLPIPFVGISADNAAAVVAKPYEIFSGSVKIKFMDTATGAFIDVTGYNPMRVIFALDL